MQTNYKEQYYSDYGSKETSLGYYDDFVGEIDQGRKGRALYIPLPYKGLSENILIQRKRYHLVTADAGVGKSAYGDLTYIIHPYEYAKRTDNVNFKGLVWKLERVSQTVGKWLALWLWETHRIFLDIRTLQSIPRYKEKNAILPDEIYYLIGLSRDYFEELFDHIELISENNPTGINKRLKDWFKTLGYKDRDTGNYVLRDPRLIPLLYVDHVGIVLDERNFDDRQKINKTSEYFRLARDRYNAFCVVIQQMNRGMMDSIRRTKMVVKPEKGDLEGSSNPFKDCDVCCGILDPNRLSLESYDNYDLAALRTPDGSSRFRSNLIMKNNWGSDAVKSAYAFYGENGYIRELPRASSLTADNYKNLMDLRFRNKLPIWDYRYPTRLKRLKTYVERVREKETKAKIDHLIRVGFNDAYNNFTYAE